MLKKLEDFLLSRNLTMPIATKKSISGLLGMGTTQQ